MARYRDGVCKLCRREGLKLFLKGDRCATDKCAIERRPYPSGQHGQGRSKFSEYGTQLREKQKVKRLYGVLEKQFRRTFYEADRRSGITGEVLLSLLESRLDNLVFRAGFARSRSEARQLVRHRHILVNGRKAMTPSMQLKAGDKIEIKEKSREKVSVIKESLEGAERRGRPSWVDVNPQTFSAQFNGEIRREEITLPITEQLIVELYSK
ncbi:MAG: 30S ribosomal protein S4 [Deltaproteobacteria bacterium]|nr:30S ribosomal protein S4 [Deltaproteobacteria bacterium]